MSGVDFLAVMDDCIAHAEKMAVCLRHEGREGVAKQWDVEVIRQRKAREAAASMARSLAEMLELRDAGLRGEINPLRQELDIVRDARIALAPVQGEMA